MIAHVTPIRSDSCDLEREFLAMLPGIRAFAEYAFRRLRPEARDEAIQEVTASAFVAFVRLVDRGHTQLAFASVLARYAVAQYLAGRRTGTRLNSADVMALGRRRRFTIESLDQFDSRDGVWREAVVEDTRTPVADQASFRVDFSEWLSRLPSRDRRVAESLAASYTTGEVAEQHGISPGRVSQLRRELQEGWERFHGQPGDGSAAMVG